jgi:hypothetical protein
MRTSLFRDFLPINATDIINRSFSRHGSKFFLEKHLQAIPVLQERMVLHFRLKLTVLPVVTTRCFKC